MGDLTDLVARRGVIKGQLSRFETFINNIRDNELQFIELRLRKSKCEENWDKFADIQSKIEILDSSGKQLDERVSFEDNYIRIIALAEGKLQNSYDGSKNAGISKNTENRAPSERGALLKHTNNRAPTERGALVKNRDNRAQTERRNHRVEGCTMPGCSACGRNHNILPHISGNFGRNISDSVNTNVASRGTPQTDNNTVPVFSGTGYEIRFTGNTVTENTVTENTVTENTVTENEVTEHTTAGNAVTGTRVNNNNTANNTVNRINSGNNNDREDTAKTAHNTGNQVNNNNTANNTANRINSGNNNNRESTVNTADNSGNNYNENSKAQGNTEGTRTCEQDLVHSYKSVRISENTDSREILLSTEHLQIMEKSGKLSDCKALLDGASKSNFMTKELWEKTGLKSFKVNIPVKGIEYNCTSIRDSVNLTVRSKCNSFQMDGCFLAIDKIDLT
ncbi:ras guanine nucleotide exchange factor Q-like [Diabrotica virgifera virgifera]|uniref:GATA zinc finger domain-containing protein 14-like n=1 Tax=Diabrotica virgifera virgifera TaxID=50390 RepID=A0ABM5K513_DIAVI|nr:ras guanine nucleotide exchange factor Q-like [Diabrotica virgifera virgifera]